MNRTVGEPRRGWDKAFRHMATEGDDRLLDEAQPSTEWDETEWTWPTEHEARS